MRIGCFGDSLTAGRPGVAYVALLREQLPGDSVFNYGIGNDTVVSLHRRISNMRFDRPLDIAFLWIGVNDVLRKEGRSVRAFNTLLGQRRARDSREFSACYRASLDHLSAQAERIIVAPPVLKGEKLENRWNRRLAELAGVIQEETTAYERAEFLDLRTVFLRELAGKPVSDYLLTNPLRIVLDTLTLRGDTQVDAKAKQRGLQLTLDGVHLNSAGANLVAREVSAAIRNPAP